MNSELLDVIAMAMYGRTRSECLAKGQCLTCGKPAGSFSNHKTAEGWAIAAMCEKCQTGAQLKSASFAE